MRILIFGLTLLLAFLFAIPAQASEAQVPGQKAAKYTRWSYPSQMSYGPIETGSADTGSAPSSNAFLTLPFIGPHYITSIFDHCGPNYAIDGTLCRYDGQVTSAKVGGPDPTFDAGYARTPGKHDYLYYDGHDGYDYGLYYEPVAAAAGGTVMLAGWAVPSCHTCSSGLTVEINHGNGLMSYYGHLSQLKVVKGQYVSRGQVIAISGSTGTATGPHLHFGIYYIDGNGPVDPYGWSGAYADPYSKDLGDLWLTGSPRFASIALPRVTVRAALRPDDPTTIDVAWSSPGAGDRFNVWVVYATGVMKLLRSNDGAGSMVFTGKHGQGYWFWAAVTTSLGWTDGGGSPPVQVPVVNHGSVT
jgi:murein DD-endopeptidase MepM/ murein hydrolase activator NlpD